MKFVIVLFICAISILPVVGQRDVSGSCVMATPPTIDGEVSDWSNEWLTDADGKFQYNICNDAAALYLRLRITDPLIQRKIGLFGLTVWMDASGKNKSKVGLKFPLGVRSDPNYNPMQRTVEGVPGERKKGEMERNLLKEVEVLELLGFSKEPLVSSRRGITNGLEVMIVSSADDAYVYEAKLPFKAFRIVKHDVDVLSVGFETGHLVPKAQSSTGAAGGYRSGGGGRGYRGGGGGGYRGSGGRGGMSNSSGGQGASRNEMMSATKFWVNAKLN